MPKNKKQDILDLFENGGNDAMLLLLDKLHELEDIVEKVVKETEKEPVEDRRVEKISQRLAAKLAVLEKGEKGDEPSTERLQSIIKPLIPEPIKGERGEKGEKGERGEKGENGKDGKDATVDETSIAQKASEISIKEVSSKLPTIEDIINDLPKLGKKIRDGLELLQGEERLEIGAIKGLRKKLKKLQDEIERSRNVRQSFGGGGGGSVSSISLNSKFITNEVIGTGDASTTDFALSHQPYTIHSVKVGSGELFETDDWSISGATISFNEAPPNGAKIRATYTI